MVLGGGALFRINRYSTLFEFYLSSALKVLSYKYIYLFSFYEIIIFYLKQLAALGHEKAYWMIQQIATINMYIHILYLKLIAKSTFEIETYQKWIWVLDYALLPSLQSVC